MSGEIAVYRYQRPLVLACVARSKVSNNPLLFLGNGFSVLSNRNISILIAVSHFFSSHCCTVTGPGLCREHRGEDDQDSAGGSTSSSTGFGGFFRIASASSYIWKRGENYTIHVIMNTKMQIWDDLVSGLTGMNCTSWKSSCMNRLEVRRNIQWAKRCDTSEYRHMSSNA